MRLQYPILPGLYLSREIAAIDSWGIDRLVVRRGSELCVTYSTDPDSVPGTTEYRAIFPIYPFFDHLG